VSDLLKILEIFLFQMFPAYLANSGFVNCCSAVLKLDSRYFKLCFVISFRKDSWGFVLLMKPDLNDFPHQAHLIKDSLHSV